MSKHDRQQQKAQQKKGTPPSAPRAPIAPPPVPPAPPTTSELQAAVAERIEAPKTEGFTESSAAIAREAGFEVGKDRLAEQGRPLTDTTAVEDLPPQTDDQKKRDADLLAKALEDEAAGKAEKMPAKKVKGFANDIVLIHNTSSSLHGIAIPAREGVKRHQATHPMIQLMPGVNPVSRLDWDEALRQVMVKLHISEGTYVELEAKSLAELGDKKALELVDLTVHRPLLLEWGDREKRPRILAAIEAQLEKIGPTPPKKGEEQEEDEDEDQE